MLPTFILAAGSSKRLGRPKQLVVIEGQPLIRRQCRIALDAGIGPVFVVLGDHADTCQREVADLPVSSLMNADFAEGLAASIRVAGAQASTMNAIALLLMHVDQYAITAEALNQLAEVWQRNPISAHLSRDGDHLGPPAIIPAAFFPALKTLQGDRGARSVLGGIVEVIRSGAALDLDVPDQLPCI